MYLIEFHRRIAFPFISLIFAMLGASLGVTNQRTGKQGGFLLSLTILFLYYLLDTFFKGLGENGFLSPIFSAWGANIILTFLTLYSVYKVNREGDFKIMKVISKPFTSLNNFTNLIRRKS